MPSSKNSSYFKNVSQYGPVSTMCGNTLKSISEKNKICTPGFDDSETYFYLVLLNIPSPLFLPFSSYSVPQSSGSPFPRQNEFRFFGQVRSEIRSLVIGDMLYLVDLIYTRRGKSLVIHDYSPMISGSRYSPPSQNSLEL